MSSLTVADVKRVAHETVEQDVPGYEVVGVHVTERDADYTEVIVRVVDCDREPCVVTVGVFRGAAEAALRNELAGKLRARDAKRRSAR
jgi:hypothetical protein